jgi:hypothetical protein
MLDPVGRTLADELRTVMERGADRPIEDRAFDELARRVFAYNHDRVPAYAAYCNGRGRGPGDVARWTEIPAVPTAAFKDLVLRAEGATAEAIFRTSGTTRGPERRGEHHVADLSLYRASLRPTFAAFVLPDGTRPATFSLVPSVADLPDSSLAFMIEDVMGHFGAGGGTFASRDGLDLPGLELGLAAATADRAPVLLLGTSAAFIHWLDDLAAGGRRHALPDGSRLMDTGGFKGGGRQVAAHELRAGYELRLGVPPHRCVNEYGMTEMLSQLYDTALVDHHDGRRRPPRKAGPPWVRSVAVDPETLDPLPPGRTGLLRHLDLANIGSVAAIQTEDIGQVDEHGLVLEGRAAGATPRGCSIAMDLLLRGAP